MPGTDTLVTTHFRHKMCRCCMVTTSVSRLVFHPQKSAFRVSQRRELLEPSIPWFPHERKLTTPVCFRRNLTSNQSAQHPLAYILLKPLRHIALQSNRRCHHLRPPRLKWSWPTFKAKALDRRTNSGFKNVFNLVPNSGLISSLLSARCSLLFHCGVVSMT